MLIEIKDKFFIQDDDVETVRVVLNKDGTIKYIKLTMYNRKQHILKGNDAYLFSIEFLDKTYLTQKDLKEIRKHKKSRNRKNIIELKPEG